MSTAMTPEELDAIEKRANAAAPGPGEDAEASVWEHGQRVVDEAFVRRPGDNIAIASQILNPCADPWDVPSKDATVADRAARACGVPETYRPHDARRRWVTELVRAGVPISTVRDLIGHRDVQTTERYVCSYYDDEATVTAPSVATVDALSDSAVPRAVPLRRQR